MSTKQTSHESREAPWGGAWGGGKEGLGKNILENLPRGGKKPLTRLGRNSRGGGKGRKLICKSRTEGGVRNALKLKHIANNNGESRKHGLMLSGDRQFGKNLELGDTFSSL